MSLFYVLSVHPLFHLLNMRISRTSPSPAIFTLKIEVPAGWHEVAIGFNNDYYDPASGTDRNLYVDEITISYQ
jgi:hypothetical protein